MCDPAARLGGGDNAQRFQFTMHGRALHTDKGGRAADVAAKAVDLGDEVFALNPLKLEIIGS